MSKNELRPQTTFSKIESLNVNEELKLRADSYNLKSVRTSASLVSRLHGRKYTVIGGRTNITVVRLA